MRLKRSKFGNIKTRIDGYTFDSKAEARRYQELMLLKKAGKIHQLSVHPRFPLKVNGKLVCAYEADFVYRYGRMFEDLDYKGIVIEDVKGVRTGVYRLKKKLFEAIHGWEITEIGVK